MSNISPRNSILIACFVVIAASAFAAPPPPEGRRTYFNFDAGANIMEDVHQEFHSVPFNGIKRDLDMDVGFRVGIAEGFSFNRFVSAELEAGFAYNELRHSDDWFGQIPLLLNVIFKYDFESGLTPFVGAGGGGSYSMAQTYAGDEDFDGDWVLAWQGIAGLRYRLTPNFDIGLVYKYLGTQSPRFELNGVTFKLEDIHNHYVGLQVSYGF